METKSEHSIIDWENGKYRGHVESGKPHGDGALVTSTGTYMGNWDNGTLNAGVYIGTNNSYYIGEFLNYQKHGTGIMHTSNSKNEGEFRNDQMHGQGKYTTADFEYKGEYKHDRKDGHGVLYSNLSLPYGEGAVYNGHWRNDVRHGKGHQYFDGFYYYDGEWENDIQHGNGTLGSNGYDDFDFKGTWKHGELYNGEGVLYSHGRPIETKCVDGNCHGIITLSTNKIYKGQFKFIIAQQEFQKHGEGKVITLDDKVIEEGHYDENVLVKGFIYEQLQNGSTVKRDHNGEVIEVQESLKSLQNKFDMLNNTVNILTNKVEMLTSAIEHLQNKPTMSLS